MLYGHPLSKPRDDFCNSGYSSAGGNERDRSADRCQQFSEKSGCPLNGGWQTADLEGLNDLLESRGIPAFQEDFVTLGFGFNVWLGRWLVGAEGHWLLERKRSTVDFERKLAGNFGFLDAGYALQIGKLQIYPIVGIGGGSMKLETVERATPSFSEVIDEPRRSSELSQLYLLGQGALRADYPIQLSQRDATASGISVGIQAGYNVAFGHWDWELGGEETSGGPAIGVEGGYIRLAVGFWTN